MNREYLSQFGLQTDVVEKIAATWDITQSSYPGGVLYYLQDDFLREAVRLARLTSDAVPAFMAQAARIRGDETLSRLSWYFHWMLHLASRDVKLKAPGLVVHPCGITFFPAYFTLANLPELKAFYRSRGIPENILSDSATAFDIWAKDYYEKHGEWGVGNLWMNQALTHNLFRLHRLEFQFGSYGDAYRIYRNTATGEICTLAPDGLRIADDGFCCQEDQTPVAVTVLWETAQSITGYPVLPNGRLGKEPVSLPVDDWSLLVRKGDPIVNIHIPALEPLAYDECKAGIGQALEFFPRYFPEFDFKCIRSSSWLFDPILAECLPPQSNILRFQSLFHLLPTPTGGQNWQFFERIFGQKDMPLEQVPQKTSLQRMLKAKLLAGVRFRGSGCFIPR